MSWNFHHQNYCNASPPLRLDNNGRSIVESDTAISDRISNIEVKKYLQRILCNGYCPRPDKTCKDQLKDGLRDLISDLNMHRNERSVLKKKDSNTAHMQTAIKNMKHLSNYSVDVCCYLQPVMDTLDANNIHLEKFGLLLDKENTI